MTSTNQISVYFELRRVKSDLCFTKPDMTRGASKQRVARLLLVILAIFIWLFKKYTVQTEDSHLLILKKSTILLMLKSIYVYLKKDFFLICKSTKGNLYKCIKNFLYIEYTQKSN